MKLDMELEVLLVTYEQLVSHCFRFGRIGHLVKDCLEEAMVDYDGKEDFQYGAWLRASSNLGRNGGPKNLQERKLVASDFDQP